MEKIPQVEEAFSKTCQLLLGDRLENLDDYEKWLKRGVRWKRIEKSEESSLKVEVPALEIYAGLKRGFVTKKECDLIGTRPSPLSLDDAESLSLANAAKRLGPLAFFSPEALMGESVCVVDMCTYFSSQYSIRGIYSNQSKFTAYCYWPRNSEYVFGSSMVFSCKFCIKCYNSENLTRCFEVSDSHSCADCYFCHNCENCNECMFCFNAKNLKHAIGNQEVGREEYLRVRGILLSEIGRRLMDEKWLDINIFDVGAGRKR